MKSSSKAYKQYKQYFEQLYPGQKAKDASEFVTISELIQEFASLRRMQIQKVNEDIKGINEQTDKGINDLKNIKFEPLQDSRYVSKNRVLENSEANKKFDFYLSNMPKQNYTRGKQEDYNSKKEQFNLLEQVEQTVESYSESLCSKDDLTAVQKDILEAIDAFKQQAFQSLGDFKSAVLDKKNKQAFNEVLGKQTADQLTEVVQAMPSDFNKVRPPKEVELRQSSEQEVTEVEYKTKAMPTPSDLQKVKHQKEDKGENSFKDFLKFNKENQSKQLGSLQALVKGQSESKKPRVKLFDPLKGFMKETKAVASKASGLMKYVPLLIMAIPLAIGALLKALDVIRNNAVDSYSSDEPLADLKDGEGNKLGMNNMVYIDTPGLSPENKLKLIEDTYDKMSDKHKLTSAVNSKKAFIPGSNGSLYGLNKDDREELAKLGKKLYPGLFKGATAEKDYAKLGLQLIGNVYYGQSEVGTVYNGTFVKPGTKGAQTLIPEAALGKNRKDAESIGRTSMMVAVNPGIISSSSSDREKTAFADLVKKYTHHDIASWIRETSYRYRAVDTDHKRGLDNLLKYYRSAKMKQLLTLGIPITPELWMAFSAVVPGNMREYMGNRMGTVITPEDSHYKSIYDWLTNSKYKPLNFDTWKESEAVDYYNKLPRSKSGKPDWLGFPTKSESFKDVSSTSNATPQQSYKPHVSPQAKKALQETLKKPLVDPANPAPIYAQAGGGLIQTDPKVFNDFRRLSTTHIIPEPESELEEEVKPGHASVFQKVNNYYDINVHKSRNRGMPGVFWNAIDD